MSRKSLVIYGSAEDPQITPIVQRLMDLDYECAFIDFDNDYRVSEIFMGGAPEVQVKLADFDGRPTDVCLLSSVVWLRNKVAVPLVRDRRDQVLNFRIVETERFLKGIIHQCGIEHFNRMPGRFSASYKTYQLSIAELVGLDTPQTLISNDKDTIVGFLSQLDRRAIVKPVHTNNPLPIADRSDSGLPILVNEIQVDEIIASDETALAIAPMQFQELIEKQYEIRAVVTLQGSAAYKVRSQEMKRSELDWRRCQTEDIFDAMTLPSDLEVKLQKFLEKLDLQYGVFDMIVGTNGYVYFLECNLDGQWAWLEMEKEETPITDLMTETIAAMLEVRDGAIT